MNLESYHQIIVPGGGSALFFSVTLAAGFFIVDVVTFVVDFVAPVTGLVALFTGFEAFMAFIAFCDAIVSVLAIQLNT